MIDPMFELPFEERPIIALDYDDTFTADPRAWHDAVATLKRAGYRVIGVTLRNREQVISNPLWHQTCEATIYCGGHAKREVAALMNVIVAVWIDDKPEYIVSTYEAMHGEPFDASIPKEVLEPVMVQAFDRPPQVRGPEKQVVYDLGEGDGQGISSWLAGRDR